MDKYTVKDCRDDISELNQKVEKLSGHMSSSGLILGTFGLIVSVLGFMGITKLNERDELSKLEPQMTALLTDSLKVRLISTLNQMNLDTKSTTEAKNRATELKDTIDLLDKFPAQNADYDRMRRLSLAVYQYVCPGISEVMDHKKEAENLDDVERQVLELKDEMFRSPSSFVYVRAVGLAELIKLKRKIVYYSDDSIEELRAAKKQDGSDPLVANALSIELANRCADRYVKLALSPTSKPVMKPDPKDDPIKKELDSIDRELGESLLNAELVDHLDSSHIGSYKTLNNGAWVKLNGVFGHLKTNHPYTDRELDATYHIESLAQLYRNLERDINHAIDLQVDNSAAYTTLAELYAVKALDTNLTKDRDWNIRESVRYYGIAIDQGYYKKAPAYPKLKPVDSAIKEAWEDDPLMTAHTEVERKQINDKIRAWFEKNK